MTSKTPMKYALLLCLSLCACETPEQRNASNIEQYKLCKAAGMEAIIRDGYTVIHCIPSEKSP